MSNKGLGFVLSRKAIREKYGGDYNKVLEVLREIALGRKLISVGGKKTLPGFKHRTDAAIAFLDRVGGKPIQHFELALTTDALELEPNFADRINAISDEQRNGNLLPPASATRQIVGTSAVVAVPEDRTLGSEDAQREPDLARSAFTAGA